MVYNPDDPAGFMIVSQNPDTKVRVREYWDARGRGYNLSTLLSLHDTEKYDHLVNSLVPRGHRARICDVGTSCGFMAIVAARLGHEVYGIDISSKMIDLARRNIRNSSLDIHFDVMDAEDPDFPDDFFDLLVFKSSMWCFTDPVRTMNRWLSKLRPGGHILIIDGNYYLSNFDKDYAQRELGEKAKGTEKNGQHGKTNMDRVDFNIIRELSKDLPVCSMRRPSWDLGLLLGLGLDNIYTNLDETEHYRAASRIGFMLLPVSFVVTARKPPENSRPLRYQDAVPGDVSVLDEEQKRCTETFKALSDTNRLLIIRYLLNGKSNVKALSGLTGLSSALVSHNLKLLLDADLVVSSKIGKEVFYIVKDPQKVQELLYYSSM